MTGKRIGTVHLLGQMDPRELKRGAEVLWRGLRTRVVHVCAFARGGVGMGEYPASWTIILQNGVVLSCDEWSLDKLNVLHESFDHENNNLGF